MVRIACACDKAVDALQRVADMSDDDSGQGPGARGQRLGDGGGHYMTPPLDDIYDHVSREHPDTGDDRNNNDHNHDDFSRHTRHTRTRSGSGLGLGLGLGLIPDEDEDIDEDNDMSGPTPDINLSATIALQRVGLLLVSTLIHTLAYINNTSYPSTHLVTLLFNTSC